MTVIYQDEEYSLYSIRSFYFSSIQKNDPQCLVSIYKINKNQEDSNTEDPEQRLVLIKDLKEKKEKC